VPALRSVCTGGNPAGGIRALVAVSKGCLAPLECRLVSARQEGDHTIFVGAIEQMGVREGRLLLFYADRYRKLEPDAPAEDQS